MNAKSQLLQERRGREASETASMTTLLSSFATKGRRKEHSSSKMWENFLRQILEHMCKLMGITGRKRKLTIGKEIIVGITAKLEGWPWIGVGMVHS